MNTKQTEALKLALEALEVATTPLAKDRQEVLRAITAIREALADHIGDANKMVEQSTCKQALQVEQPSQQQEPVAQEWRYYFSHSGATGKPDEVVGPCFTDRKEVAFGVGCFDQTALIPPASKPWVGLTDEDFLRCLGPEAVRIPQGWYKIARAIEAKLREKNAQPSKPLTQEHIERIFLRYGGDMMNCARAIEREHGIKGDA